MEDFETYYDVLELSESATKEDIKKAYRKLVHEYHPDKNVNATEKVKRLAEDKFKEIQEAYDTLNNSQKKSQYDTRLKELRARQQRKETTNATSYQTGTSKSYKAPSSLNLKLTRKQVLSGIAVVVTIILITTYGSSSSSPSTESTDVATSSQPVNASATLDAQKTTQVVSKSTTGSLSESCTEKVGMHSSFDSDSQKCVCDAGYIMDSGTCISGYSHCANNYPNSYWDGAECACISGYIWNSTQTSCITPSDGYAQQCQSKYGASSYYTGQLNSNGGPICGCSNGSQWSAEKTACLSTTDLDQSCQSEWPNTYYTGKTSSEGKNLCDCKNGYYWDNSQTGCYSSYQFNQQCQNSYGPGSSYSTFSKSCSCNYGYTWSDSTNWCVKKQ